MGWTFMVGAIEMHLFPGAIIVSALVLAALFITRSQSLQALEHAPEFRERHRYVRGARWGWALALGAFLVVVAAMGLLLEHTVWDMRAAALAWAAALFPLAGSAGLLMLEEFMGYWVWAQAAWDRMGGLRTDWAWYRAVTERIACNRARWAYYGAWVVGSVGLTVGPLVSYTMVH